MRILFITHYDNMYGANQALYRLIRCLKTEHGVEVELIIPACGEMTQEMEKIGVPYIVHAITQWQAIYTGPLRFFIKRQLRRKAIEDEVAELFDLIKDRHIDVIHSNSSVVGTGAMLANKLGCRHIWHIREFSKEHYHMRYFYSRKVINSFYENADLLITISDALKENYQKKYPKAKIIRIYDGVNENKDASYQQNNSASQKMPVRFCYIGYLFPMKQQFEVVKACWKLNQMGVTNYEFWLLGDGKESYKRKIKKYIKQKHLTQVKMPGFVENANQLLETMDVGVIASMYEGFGLVTVEYMLHSLPVIGRRSGGTAEIIQDEITGYLYEEPDVLPELMKSLLENKELRQCLGQAGRERAVSCFTEEQNAQAISKIYEQIGKGAI